MVLAGTHQEVSELRPYLANAGAQVVLVDIDPEPSKALDDLNMIMTDYPTTCAVILANRSTKELLLAAMQAGARHLLRKKAIRSDLVQVLEQLTLNGARKNGSSGSIISVFSAGGGCGATTVAFNLANELRLASSKPVLAIDLDSSYGTMSAYLHIAGHYGIADVLDHKGPIDEHLVMSSACNYMRDFHVLASPVSTDSCRSKSLRYEHLIDALEACRRVYRYTVIDAPRVDEDVAANLAAVSSVVLIVFQLTFKDVKLAHCMLSSLADNGIAPERIIPLSNRFSRRGLLLGLEDSKKALGLDSVHRIRSDWRRALNSVNRGLPLAQVAPRSGLRNDFRKLAAEIRACETNGNKVMVG
jgi:pilus assembly protein CpaE